MIGKKIIGFLKRVLGLSNELPDVEQMEQKERGSRAPSGMSPSGEFQDPSYKKSKPHSLSNQEVKYLIEIAESCIHSRTFDEAISHLSEVIENSNPHPYYFKRRGFCHRMMENFNKAIDDFNEALKLDPDDGVTYWERGACYIDKPYFQGIMDENKKKDLLQKALKDYKSSIERIPTSQEAWLALICINLCLFNFDDAISDYGGCKPYILTKEYQLVRSWSGCLALTLAGESIEEDDGKSLNDQSIRLKWYHWNFFPIDILLKELEQKGFNRGRLGEAKEIHQKFIEHFDEPNLCFNSANRKNKRLSKR